MNATTIITSILTSTVSVTVIVFLFKTFITEKIKGMVKFEYSVELENHKSDLKQTLEKEIGVYKKELDEKERINNEKWLLKREACLRALEIADAVLSNMDWNLGSEIAIVKQEVDTIEFRKCYNQLSCSCDNPEVLAIFKKATSCDGPISGDIMTDLRNEVRKELNFGDTIDTDRTISFFGRIHGDKKGL